MKRLLPLAALLCAMPTGAAGYSLADLSGAWWSACDDAAAVFVIDGKQYSGDFAGRHRLRLDGDVLVFEAGLPEGHGIDVSGTPMSFRILLASERRLELAPLDEAGGADPWTLQACD